MKKKNYKEQNSNKHTLNARASYLNEEDEAPIDNLIPALYKDDLEKKLEDIYSQIEIVGKVCDVKMAQSYEEYHNSIKSNKAQLWDDLTKLNFKLIEFKKQNTKEDFVNKLKSDLKNITEQVHQKDKELTLNNKTLQQLETKLSELKEEKTFLNNEIKNSKYYNKYLLSKLKDLEESDIKDVYEEWLKSAENNEKEKKILDEIKLEKSSYKYNSEHHDLNDKDKRTLNIKKHNIKQGFSSGEEDNLKAISDEEELNDVNKAEKLEHYLEKNIDIMNNKLVEMNKKITTKYKRLSLLEKFNNPILQILNEKTKLEIENLENKKNSKLTSKDVFFNQISTMRSISLKTASELQNKQKEVLTNQNSNEKVTSKKDVLHKRDKREIVKKFLTDETVKRHIYEILYKENPV